MLQNVFLNQSEKLGLKSNFMTTYAWVVQLHLQSEYSGDLNTGPLNYGQIWI